MSRETVYVEDKLPGVFWLHLLPMRALYKRFEILGKKKVVNKIYQFWLRNLELPNFSEETWSGIHYVMKQSFQKIIWTFQKWYIFDNSNLSWAYMSLVSQENTILGYDLYYEKISFKRCARCNFWRKIKNQKFSRRFLGS